ncbi:MAG: type II secretion system major pseudopilin GspG [Gammaproteobacteria bacterium]|nr:type II secretion system major pseudopilin GspG [Gammaproteobacteria bacterium]
MKKVTRTAQAGFTLIEIMVVVVIIGLLATLILPNVLGRQDQALQVKAKADIRAIAGQMALYKLDNFAYPTTAEGIQALVSNPGGKGTWRGYLDKLPKDPWNNDYQYLRPGQKNPTSFDLWSYGADGVAGGEGTDKDIGNWEE